MLSRTADHLFWLARYMERAENTSRMLDVNLQNALLPQSNASEEQGLQAILRISELETAFQARHDRLSGPAVVDFMVRDPENPSSIYNCIAAARENARAVRGALTTELWETLNDTWLEFRKLLADDLLERDAQHLFEWVKFRSHLSRGVSVGTSLHDEAYYFMRLGTYLERADNTARMLDVRFHEAQQDMRGDEDPTHPTDFYYWAAVLRSVSGFEIYRKVYRDVITPERVIELLILNPRMPRSLLAALNGVCQNIEVVRNRLSQDCERYAGKLRAELTYTDIDQILAEGMHTYLTDFLERMYILGNKVSQTFLIPLTS